MWKTIKTNLASSSGTDAWIISFNDKQVGRISYAPEQPGVGRWQWNVDSERPDSGRAWTVEAAVNAVKAASGEAVTEAV